MFIAWDHILYYFVIVKIIYKTGDIGKIFFKSLTQTDHINPLYVIQSIRLSFHYKTNVPTTTCLIDRRLYLLLTKYQETLGHTSIHYAEK